MEYTHHRTWEANLFVDSIENIDKEEGDIHYKFVQIHTTAHQTPVNELPVAESIEALSKPISWMGQPQWEPGPDRLVSLPSLVGMDHVVLESTWSMHPSSGWITHIPYPSQGQLFHSPLPYSKQNDPHGQVLEEWKREGVDVIICLLPKDEFRRETGQEMEEFFMEHTLPVLYFPMTEFEMPSGKKKDLLLRLLFKVRPRNRGC
jgi:hypothetical protein